LMLSGNVRKGCPTISLQSAGMGTRDVSARVCARGKAITVTNSRDQRPVLRQLRQLWG
jgi:hypothetical protein